MPLIKTDILTIYERYNGDNDHLARKGSETELATFGNSKNSPWYLIGTALQDAYLISNKLVSDEYTKNVLIELKANCDEVSFKKLTGHITFYSDFQAIVALLIAIKQKTDPETDYSYTRFDSLTDLQNYMDTCIADIALCDFDTLAKISLDFAPTGTYQELSISNGWATDYLKLAEEFDTFNNNINLKISLNGSSQQTIAPKQSSAFHAAWDWLFNKHA